MSGLYIHIPFCRKACTYCDFHFSTSLKTKPAVLEAMHAELEQRAGELAGAAVETIYFGGGTPSQLSDAELRAFLDQVRETLEDVLRENQRLREDIQRKDAEIASMRDAESDLKQTLTLARRVAEDLEWGARREADVLLGEARLEAEKILMVATDEQRALHEDLMRLRASRARLSAELRAVVNTHARILDDLDRAAGNSS